MSCYDATKDSYRHPYGSTENMIAYGVMAILAIVGTVIIFGYRERVNRPCIVTYLWIIIDLAILSYIVSLAVMPFMTDSENFAFEVGYHTYYTAIVLNMLFHWTFASEYLKAVLKLPAILDIVTESADKRLKIAKYITRGATIFFYGAVILWICLNNFAIRWMYQTYASRYVTSIL